ncbi:MAG TPA: hypothetical protein VE684_13590 [Crenalkalicoccus sp.]|nr:hypothetical protein [Crenalkalicoccus sp.]
MRGTRRQALGAAAALLGARRGRAQAALALGASARPGPAFRAADFAMVGVFDADWLATPLYARVLDMMAASSPAGFAALRCFGILNAGVRENVVPVESGGTWPALDAPMDFAASLAALEALVARGITPFLALTFFPAAVSPSPIEPPPDFAAWQRLVAGFLDAAVARFGAAAVASWWLEVWNEPNMPPFWRGSFGRYLDLYRATAAAVARSGHRVRLGGPAIAWVPQEGPSLMRRFLEFLRDEPEMPCAFLSYHRKGIWVTEETEPRIGRLAEAAEFTAEEALRLVPERCRDLAIVNNEADMKVGFDAPYEPRMSERFPAWLAAVAATHAALSARYEGRGLRFLAAADNANQHLVRAPFDGRRALLTRSDASPLDLIKLPVFGFYEMLRLLGDRLGKAEAPARDDLFHLVTVGEGRIAALLARHPPAPGGAPLTLAYTLRDIPWPMVNLAVFRLDATHGNAFAAAGRRMPAAVPPAEAARLRAVAELGADPPLRSGLAVPDGSLRLDLTLDPYATLLVWVTPQDPAPPAAPRWLEARAEDGRVLLRWTPDGTPGFWSFEVARLDAAGTAQPIAPVPLRAASWVDTAQEPGPWRYTVRARSASGMAGPVAVSDPVTSRA